MSRFYMVKLSPHDAVTVVNQRLVDGRTVRVPVKTRALELEILDASFNALANQTQHLSEYVQCVRYCDLIQKVTDQVAINLAKSDMENLIKGFELTKDKRPDNWVRCVSFFTQLDAPIEIEVDPPKEEIKKGEETSPPSQ